MWVITKNILLLLLLLLLNHILNHFLYQTKIIICFPPKTCSPNSDIILYIFLSLIYYVFLII